MFHRCDECASSDASSCRLTILGLLVIYPLPTLLPGTLTDTNPVVDGVSLSHTPGS